MRDPRTNRPEWNTIQADVLERSGAAFAGQVDLFAGGVPCPPFSKAGKEPRADDERNLFPRALELIEEIGPRAVMIENARGLLDPVFQPFRDDVDAQLEAMGYNTHWKLLQASDFGVSQLRPRVVLVALKEPWADHFTWPEPNKKPAPTVGELLELLMAANGWRERLPGQPRPTPSRRRWWEGASSTAGPTSARLVLVPPGRSWASRAGRSPTRLRYRACSRR